MKAKAFSISLLLMHLIIMTPSCSQNKAQWKGTIEKIDGVTIVRNPTDPLYGPDSVVFNEELSIGKVEGAEEYLFGYIRHIVVDEKENIYVSDVTGSKAQIRVFNKSGEYIRTIGRMGQGPGEFNQASNIQITPNNELMIHDRLTLKLIFFSLDGTYLRDSNYRGVQAVHVQVNSNGNYFFTSVEFQRQKVSNSYYAATKVDEFGPDLNFIKSIVKDEYRNVTGPVEPPAMVIRFPSSDSIFCGLTETYEFHIYDTDGQVIKKVSRDFNPVEISEYEKGKRKLGEMDGVPKYFRAFYNFSVDEDGRVFVQTYERQSDKDKFNYDVFDPDGRYVAKIPLNDLPKYWKDGKMYASEEDENGYIFIKRYKVTWKF